MASINNIANFFTKTHIKITIIIPIYNAEEYIQKCIDSILQQGVNPIEIIVVNDCSTDNSLKLLNEYNKHNTVLSIINNPTNKGAGAARNIAVKKAKGKYITFIDSDDWLGPNYLKYLYNEAVKTNADIVFSNLMMVNHNTESKHNGTPGLINKYNNNGISLIDFPNEWRSTAPWMKLYRSDFIVKNELQFLEGIKLGAEDISFSWTSYFIAEKIAFSDNVYYYYNYVPDSLDRFVNESILEIFDALQFTKKEYQRFDPNHIRHAQLDTLFVSHAFYQFSKITKSYNLDNIILAEKYWRKAHTNLIKITPYNIISNNFLYKNEKLFYFNIINNPCFDTGMQKIYFLATHKLNGNAT